jgi:hypothetical protein
MMVKLRQLNWWETILQGDRYVLAGREPLNPATFYVGWTVDQAFEYVRNTGDTIFFYRQVDQ